MLKFLFFAAGIPGNFIASSWCLAEGSRLERRRQHKERARCVRVYTCLSDLDRHGGAT